LQKEHPLLLANFTELANALTIWTSYPLQWISYPLQWRINYRYI